MFSFMLQLPWNGIRSKNCGESTNSFVQLQNEMPDCISFSSIQFSFSIIQNLHKRPPKLYSRSITLHTSRNDQLKLFMPTKATKNSREFYSELGFKEKGDENFELESATQSDSTDLEVVEFKNKKIEIEDSGGQNGQMRVKNRKQVIRRSNMLAKQVISVQSAVSLGFVSQIWVDTTSWMVLVMEVRPNLLSGESERFLLEDVKRVGDVVLVEDENVLENELRLVGLETLVGYDVVTQGERYIGKVRNYSFNINSGAVELLELDSFGISIIPSSLVSTYALPVEDVLEVLSDTVIVHEAAASRIQRLTKGLWDAQNVGSPIDEMEELSDSELSSRSDDVPSKKSSSRSQKFRNKIPEYEDNLDLPMDYL